MIMLFTVGFLAGRTWRARLGYAALAFGVWDIAYYVFLKIMCGWPHSLGDWDVLFLLPLPWWGPVLAPMLIALLLILWGTFSSQFEHNPRPAMSNWRAWLLYFAGIALALYVFMADALEAAPRGVEAIRTVLPEKFNWPLFCIAWLLMAAPGLQIGGQYLWRNRVEYKPAEPPRKQMQAQPEIRKPHLGELATLLRGEPRRLSPGSKADWAHASRCTSWSLPSARAVMARPWAGGAIRNRHCSRRSSSR